MNTQAPAVILLHGYLESADIWAEFAPLLKSEHPIIAYDIPGHGSREAVSGENMMQAWVEHLHQTILDEDIKKVILVGHSMGGYLAAAYAQSHPDMLAGLCLFHSHPYADPEEKRASRLSSIDNIRQGKHAEICQNHAPNIYAADNVERFKDKIAQAVKIAQNMTPEAHIASLRAMLDRTDASETVVNLDIPFLLIHGKKDRLIPNEVAEGVKLPAKGKLAVLENSGHAGFIEEPKIASEILNDFIKSVK